MQVKQSWYKEPWPWILMAGPGLVIVAGVITAWLAVKSNDGLVADDYYKQGLAVNQRLQRDHGAEKYGVRAEVMHAGVNLRLLLSLKPGTQVPEKLVLNITHPTRAGMDQNITLVAEGQGLYVGKLVSELSGRWHVSLEEPAGQWRLTGDWMADRPETLLLVAAETTSTDRSVTGR